MKPIGVHVVYVDDEKDMHFLVEAFLSDEIESGKIRMTYSSSAKECLDYIVSDDAVDVILVLSDINMPEMTGIEMLPTLKKYKNVMVYMVTAYDTSEHRQLAFDRGAKRFFTKPIDFDELKRTMNKDLGQNIFDIE